MSHAWHMKWAEDVRAMFVHTPGLFDGGSAYVAQRATDLDGAQRVSEMTSAGDLSDGPR
jgi:hypothetical protein